VNAILYLLRTGFPWRYLPRQLSAVVDDIFGKFQRDLPRTSKTSRKPSPLSSPSPAFGLFSDGPPRRRS
jgi:hypothetical protein